MNGSPGQDTLTDRITAISALYQADRTDNQAILNVSLAMLGAGVAYVVGTLALIGQFGTSISWLYVSLLPFPTWLIISFQSLLFAAGTQHGLSAVILEQELFQVGGIAPGQRKLVGALAGENVFNTDRSATPHTIATFLSYGGSASIFVAYTVILVTASWPHLGWAAWPVLGLYVVVAACNAWSWVAGIRQRDANWKAAGLHV